MFQRSTRGKFNLYDSYIDMQDAKPSVLQNNLYGSQSPLGHDLWCWLKSATPIYSILHRIYKYKNSLCATLS